MYRFIEPDTRSRNVAMPYARLVPTGLPPRVWWWGGRPLREQLTLPLTIEVEDAPRTEAPPGLTDFFRTTNVRLASARMRRVLESVGAEVEFWPARILYSGSEVAGEFFAVTALHARHAIDFRLSDIEMEAETGMALTAKKVVLDESALAGVHWAVVKEVNRIAVSEALGSALMDAALQGIRLVDPAEVSF